jgi:hypothetical protein
MADTVTDPSAEPVDRKAQQCAQKWIAELGVSEKHQRAYLERAKKIVRMYKRQDNGQGDVETDASRRKFPMLWANTETLKPVVYARAPEPVVSRRFDDADPVGRVVCEILERALATSLELQDLDGRLRECRDDYLLIGRGVPWERYVPTHGPEVVPEPVALQVIGEGAEVDGPAYTDDDGNKYAKDAEGVTLGEDGQSATYQAPAYRPVIYEESITDYVNWEDFGHGVARTWPEVPYVWRRVYLGRDELVKRFGAVGKVVPLDWGPVQQGIRDVGAEMARKAAVYEIWDKASKCVYWISKSWTSRPLDERKDPLGLPDFWPCPRPLLATTTNDSLIPTPDFAYYQGQAAEIDKLTGRISELQDALKVRGFYAGSEKTNLNTLFSASNNILIPVPEWLGLKENGGARGMVEYWPIDMVVAALDALIKQRQQLINDVYQITGIGDVLRGMSDPRATATAEHIKGVWGTLRVRDKQKEMIRFARDILRIKASVIAQKFDPETLKLISGVKLPTNAEKQALQAQVQQGAQLYQLQVQQAQAAGQPVPPPPQIPPEVQQALGSPTWEDAIALMRDQPLRQFRIDIETDSTVEPDEQEEKASMVEFIGAIGQFMTSWGPIVAAQPAMAPVAASLLKAAARRFRAGREFEQVLDEALNKLGQAPPPQQPATPPDKSLEVAQVTGQARIEQEKIKQAGEDGRAQLQASIDAGDQALEADALKLKLVIGGRDPEPQVTA